LRERRRFGLAFCGCKQKKVYADGRIEGSDGVLAP
jgi:hypothetical protein